MLGQASVPVYRIMPLSCYPEPQEEIRMARFFLFIPPGSLYRRDDRCQSKVADQTIRAVFPPLDLAYMAAILRQAGHEVRMADYPASRRGILHLQKDLTQFAPDCVIYTCTAPTLENDLQLAGLMKQWKSDLSVAVKGEPANFLDERMLHDYPAIDFVLRGEAEGILKRYVKGMALEEIPGVTAQSESGIRRNPAPTELLDLDTLPFPARDLLDNSLYPWPETGDPMTTVLTSQGCPFECIFCPVVPLTGKRVRFRSVESILGELHECIDRFNIRHFLFHADTFTLKKQWVVDLCRAIVEQGLSIEWAANSRVDTIDKERLEWMKRAGCRIIGFGVESGMDEHLQAMGKNTTTQQARHAVRLCRECGIRSHAFFVFGFPWDTEESIRKTIHFALELDPDFFDFNLAFPIPGTELYRMVVEEGLCDLERLKQGGYSVAALRTRTVSAERLEQLRRTALWRLYLRPGYVVRTLAATGSPLVAWRYCRAAVKRIANLLFGV